MSRGSRTEPHTMILGTIDRIAVPTFKKKSVGGSGIAVSN